MLPELTLRPTRYNFAVAALSALADEGRALLIGDDDAAGQPAEVDDPQIDGDGGASIVPGYDDNFGLSDDEIMHPSRETIVNWLRGKTPMLASHWSKIAAKMLEEDTNAAQRVTDAPWRPSAACWLQGALEELWAPVTLAESLKGILRGSFSAFLPHRHHACPRLAFHGGDDRFSDLIRGAMKRIVIKVGVSCGCRWLSVAKQLADDGQPHACASSNRCE